MALLGERGVREYGISGRISHGLWRTRKVDAGGSGGVGCILWARVLDEQKGFEQLAFGRQPTGVMGR